MQLKMDKSFVEKVIPANDSMRRLDKGVEEMDIGELSVLAYSTIFSMVRGGAAALWPCALYALMSAYSSRKVLLFLNLLQVPVDLRVHIRYTDLEF